VTSLVFDVFVRERTRVNQCLRDEFQAEDARSRRMPLFRDLGGAVNGSEPGGPSAWIRLRLILEQCDLKIGPAKLLALSAAAAILPAVGVAVVIRQWQFAVLAGLVGSLVPVAFVLARHKRRVLRLTTQLPEALELMSRAVRAGQTVTNALQLVANDCAPPLGKEFAYCCEQQNLGLPQEVTLRELARRTGLAELQMFAVALIIQRQTGGNPVELFDNLSAVIRKRIRAMGKMKALTGEGRMQAVVLSLLPFAMFLAILAVNASYVQELLDRPYLLIGVIVAEIIGGLWIRKISTDSETLTGVPLQS
jgi:tight adherence protein B